MTTIVIPDNVPLVTLNSALAAVGLEQQRGIPPRYNWRPDARPKHLTCCEPDCNSPASVRDADTGTSRCAAHAFALMRRITP
jgi:hypothetical protein